jgi:hypothetical protein
VSVIDILNYSVFAYLAVATVVIMYFTIKGRE